MPGMRGFEAVEKIRRIKQDVKIAVLTDYTESRISEGEQDSPGNIDNIVVPICPTGMAAVTSGFP